jgi:hypothetical protein
MMVGDKRKYNVALVTVKTEPDQEGGFTNQLIGEALLVDSSCKTVADAMVSGKWKEYIKNGIIKYNITHAVSNAQKVCCWGASFPCCCSLVFSPFFLCCVRSSARFVRSLFFWSLFFCFCRCCFFLKQSTGAKVPHLPRGLLSGQR